MWTQFVMYPKVSDSSKKVGFKCVTLANNHFRDYGDSAIIKTLALFDKYEIDHVGGGTSLSDSQKFLLKILAILNLEL